MLTDVQLKEICILLVIKRENDKAYLAEMAKKEVKHMTQEEVVQYTEVLTRSGITQVIVEFSLILLGEPSVTTSSKKSVLEHIVQVCLESNRLDLAQAVGGIPKV